jgi:hypothetical protein
MTSQNVLQMAIKITYAELQALTAVSMKMAVLWPTALCRLIEAYRRFRGTFIIALMMVAACTFGTSLNFYHTSSTKM